jgi:hypothetical protein
LPGVDPHRSRGFCPRCSDSAASQAVEVTTKEKVVMQIALIYAFVVVAGAPLIGIWRGHVWAKANGMVLRTTATSEQNQTA